MIHIAFIIPYQDSLNDVEEVLKMRFDSKKLTCDIIIAQDNEILFMELPKADIFIARGFAAMVLKRGGIPCVEINTTGYDVLIAVNECIQTYGSRKIAVLGTPGMVGGVSMIQKIFQTIEMVSYSFEKKEQMIRFLDQISCTDVDAVIGGLSAKRKADSLGFPSALLHVGKEAIGTAIEEAVRTVEITRREAEKNNRLQTILDYTFEGILSIDQNGTIIMCNKVAVSALSIQGETLVGAPIMDYLPFLEYQEIINDHRKLISQIHKIGELMVSVNCIPLIDDNKSLGAVITFQNASYIQEAESQIRKRLYRKGFIAKKNFEDIIFEDQKTLETIETAKWYAASNSNILIVGETGTGKELFTQSIHNASNLRNGPFVAINCAALPEQLLESELFGYVDGAFTGAAKGGKIGLFELSHNGTLFLDEIGDISPRLQSSLLRVIQEQEIIRLGDDKITPIRVRIICATNKDLDELVDEKCFRQDLLYRLEVLKLTLPPLRERRSDVLPLIRFFIRKEQERSACRLQDISPSAQDILEQYDWPGNIRQLRNFCERICVLCRDKCADEETVQRALGTKPETRASVKEAGIGAFKDVRKSPGKNQILNALELCNGSRKQAAAQLGIDTSTLWRRMKKFKIPFEQFK